MCQDRGHPSGRAAIGVLYDRLVRAYRRIQGDQRRVAERGSEPADRRVDGRDLGRRPVRDERSDPPVGAVGNRDEQLPVRQVAFGSGRFAGGHGDDDDGGDRETEADRGQRRP